MHLTDEQRQTGKDNYARVLGGHPTRRDFFKNAIGASILTGSAGATYYNYDKKLEGGPLPIGVIGTGDEGSVLIGALNPDFIEVKAIADIRPYSQHRAFHGDNYSAGTIKARPGLMRKYGWKTEDEARKHVDVYEDYEELLARDDIQAVIIALPLFLHDVAAIKAMKAGKHVLTEKLMAHSVSQCKEMARVAEATELLLATGHQRHYSILYANAVDTIRRGVIGDIHHIRAQWHRNNLPSKDSWTPPLPTTTQKMTKAEIGKAERAAKSMGIKEAVELWRKKNGYSGPDDLDEQAKLLEQHVRKASGDSALAAWRDQYKLVRELDAWERKRADLIKKKARPSEIETWEIKIAQKSAQLADISLQDKLAQYGYQGGTKPNGDTLSPLEELIRWRLWNRTGGGLMAELGSHQLDASGIFISSQFKEGVKARPLSVTAVGGRHIFPADRDVDDHVYCSYEYPGKEYFDDNDPEKGVADENKKVVVTYSSINGNDYGGYGEVVMGTSGTLILEREKDTLLFGSKGTSTKVGVDGGDKLTDSYETGGAAVAVTTKAAEVSRGYTEEIEHWAWCIKNNEPAETLHCHPKVALADAVIALVSNIAIANKERIEFKKEWFDPKSDAVPPGETKPRKAEAIT